MAKRDDKFGSSFDPRNGGKAQRPVSDRELHQLRGCRDPNCPVCNPETAGRGWTGSLDPRSSRYLYFVDPNPNPFVSSDFNERMIEEMAKMGYGRSPVSSSPPASYTAARENVKQWILEAPEQAFEDIVGNEEALEQLRDAIQAPVKHKELYEAYGMKMPKGAMLSGPPGCGKTMFARAAASEMKKLYGGKTEFLSLSGAELQSMWVGETEMRIKNIFNYAREYKAYHGHPLLVFMDEADVILPDRTGRVRRVASWEESNVATFLAEMDGIQDSGAFIMIATNRPGVIDSAVLRDGRCDFKIVVKRPTQEAVEVILKKNFDGILMGEDDQDTLIFAALESLYSPHRVLMEAQLIRINIKDETIDLNDKHFLLAHIISGAIAASIPNRAKRHAFSRDKLTGIAKGVTASDVVKAVSDIFEENKILDHSFALEEFKQEFIKEIHRKKVDGTDSGRG